MKRDRFRRLAAMMLAAATLWVTAAAMGSDSLRDAAAAVRDSVRLPETLLRWELGDMAAADTLALPALLALRESPLLLSAWADVAALPQTETAPEKTPAAPVPVTPAPQPEAEPSGHEDNGAASQTIAPASPSGFVQVGDVFIKNNSTKALEPGWFDGTFAAKLSEDAPQFVKDYYAYCKTPRGCHPRSLNFNNGWNVASSLSFLNMPILQYSSEIRSAVLLVHHLYPYRCKLAAGQFPAGKPPVLD